VATVVLQPTFARRHTDGVTRIEVPAANYQALIEALDERYPGFADAVTVRVAVAIDGQIYQDPLLEPIGPGSEVFFLPPIEGG
jgi:molybdopterin converting factor small subunit